jgi:hypothetical protein
MQKSAASGSSVATGKVKETKKKQFGREIRLMMYGFGDDPNPRPDTVSPHSLVTTQH